MAVFWLVFDGAEGQMRMISVLATPARGRWVNQCLVRVAGASQVWSERLATNWRFTKDGRSPPQTNKEASHASLRSARRLRDEKPGDLCSPAQAAALCTACAHNWAASRRIALTNTHRGAQQSHRSRDSRVQPPKHQARGCLSTGQDDEITENKSLQGRPQGASSQGPRRHRRRPGRV